MTITTSGRPVLIQAQIQQYKMGSCVQRGYMTVKLDGAMLLDPEGGGMASSYECSAVASLQTLQNLAAGTHRIELMEMGDNGGVCTHGIFDFLYVYELPN